MNTNLSIKNFRVFDQNGVSVDLRPISILTGCNSSGKSSIVKAILLLDHFLSCNRVPDENSRLDFNQEPLSSLGDFDAILNKKDKKKGTRDLILRYSVDSSFFGAGTVIQLTFTLSSNGACKEGIIKEVEIARRDGTTLYRGDALHLQSYAQESFADQAMGFVIRRHDKSLSLISELKRDFFYHYLFNRLVWDQNYGDEHTIDDSYFENYSKGVLKAFQDNFDSQTVATSFISNCTERYWDNNNSFGKSYFSRDFPDGALKYGIIIYLPVLEELNSWEKPAFKECFEKRFGKTDDLICDSFINSPYDRFIEYYRFIEDTFLNQNYSLLQLSTGVSSQINYLHYQLVKDATEHQIVSLQYIVNRLLEFILPCEYITHDHFEESIHHKLLDSFIMFCRKGIDDLFSTHERVNYVGSTRLSIQRVYPKQSQKDNVVVRYMEAVKRYPGTGQPFVPGSFIDKWIQLFGVGHHLTIQDLHRGIGYTLIINKTETDKTGQLAADLGYGITQLLSILLEVEISIITRLSSKTPLSKALYLPDILASYTEVFSKKRLYPRDYSKIDFDSLALPLHSSLIGGPHDDIKTQLKYCAEDGVTIAIEEPEIHLHPRYQSILAEMFVDAYNSYGIQFIIETHSEYLIRKLQTLIAQKTISPEDVSLLYTESENGRPNVRKINVDHDGRLQEPFGSGFFDEADSLAMKLLLIKGGLV